MLEPGKGYSKAASRFLVLLFLCAAWRLAAAAFHPSNLEKSTNSALIVQETLARALNLQPTSSNTFRIGQIELDPKARTVAIPSRVHLINQVVEYALVTEQGKAYESLLTTEARPTDIQVACLLLGLSQSSVTGHLNTPAPVDRTNAVRIEIFWQTNGTILRFPLADLIQLTSGHPDEKAPCLQLRDWLYNGSVLNQAGFAAANEGSIISLIRDASALINNPGPDRDRDECHFPYSGRLPPVGTQLTVIITAPPK